MIKHLMVSHAAVAAMLVLTKSSLFRVERFTRANEMPAFRAVRVCKTEKRDDERDKCSDPFSLSAV